MLSIQAYILDFVRVTANLYTIIIYSKIAYKTKGINVTFFTSKVITKITSLHRPADGNYSKYDRLSSRTFQKKTVN